MSQSKTDKIRERLKGLKGRDLTVAEEEKLFQIVEAVVEECYWETTESQWTSNPKQLAENLLDIIANELDVEEG